MKELTLVIPVFNEARSLERLLPEVEAFCRRQGCRAIWVNDGSTDGSAALLDRHARPPVMEVVHLKLNRGYGGAIKAGIRRVRTPLLVTLDGDGQHDLGDVLRLYERKVAADADMVVGRRSGLGDHWYRRLGKRLLRGVARLLMPVTVEDLNSGMKLYDTALAKKYIRLCPDSMAFSDVITLVFLNQRRRVEEVDIQVRPRTTGVSTINTMTAIDTLAEIINIVVLFNPSRIFLPLALLFVAAGFAWGLPMLWRGAGVSAGVVLLWVSGLLFFLLGLLAQQLSLIRRDRVED